MICDVTGKPPIDKVYFDSFKKVYVFKKRDACVSFPAYSEFLEVHFSCSTFVDS